MNLTRESSDCMSEKTLVKDPVIVFGAMISMVTQLISPVQVCFQTTDFSRDAKKRWFSVKFIQLGCKTLVVYNFLTRWVIPVSVGIVFFKRLQLFFGLLFCY